MKGVLCVPYVLLGGGEVANDREMTETASNPRQ